MARRNYAMLVLCLLSCLCAMSCLEPSWYFTRTSHHRHRTGGVVMWKRRCGIFACEAGGSLRDLRGETAALTKAASALAVLGVLQQLIAAVLHAALAFPAVLGARLFSFTLLYRGAKNMAVLHAFAAILVMSAVLLAIVNYMVHHRSTETHLGPTLPLMACSVAANIILIALCVGGKHLLGYEEHLRQENEPINEDLRVSVKVGGGKGAVGGEVRSS